jgi:hypothetical protein
MRAPCACHKLAQAAPHNVFPDQVDNLRAHSTDKVQNRGELAVHDLARAHLVTKLREDTQQNLGVRHAWKGGLPRHFIEQWFSAHAENIGVVG